MIRREIESQLLALAGMHPMVTLTGPRQSGKTTLARAAFPSHHYVSLENFDLREAALADPGASCASSPPRQSMTRSSASRRSSATS